MSEAHESPFQVLQDSYAERFDQLVEGRVTGAAPADCGVDVSAWPLVVAVAIGPSGSLGFRDMVECIGTLTARGPFAVVIDVSARPPLTSPERHFVAVVRAVAGLRHPDDVRAGAWVTATEEQERALLPLSWLTQPRQPIDCFRERDAAIASACARLTAADLAAPVPRFIRRALDASASRGTTAS